MAQDTRDCLKSTRPQDLAGGTRPWSPGRREEDVDIERAAANPDDRVWCMAEVDIFCDLNTAEMDAMSAAAPMRTYAAGELVYTPHQPLETLYILKKGRIRIFRVSPEGRALTTAIIEPGTIFGEMIIVGQQMHDSFAEALDDVVVCVMTKADVQRLLLGDVRIAARISETLGRRLGEREQRLSDATFKTVPERIAGTLLTLAGDQSSHPLSRGIQVKLNPRTARRPGRHLPGNHHQDPQRVRRAGLGQARPRPDQHPRPRPHAPSQQTRLNPRSPRAQPTDAPAVKTPFLGLCTAYAELFEPLDQVAALGAWARGDVEDGAVSIVGSEVEVGASIAEHLGRASLSTCARVPEGLVERGLGNRGIGD